MMLDLAWADLEGWRLALLMTDLRGISMAFSECV